MLSKPEKIFKNKKLVTLNFSKETSLDSRCSHVVLNKNLYIQGNPKSSDYSKTRMDVIDMFNFKKKCKQSIPNDQ
jgi:hypothetical protein